MMSSEATEEGVSFLKNIQHLSKQQWSEEDIIYVITINPKSPMITLEWLIDILKGNESDIVRDDGGYGRSKFSIAYVTSDDLSDPKLFASFKTKKHLSTEIHLLIGSKDLYENLSYSEKQKMVLSRLEGLHILEKSVLFGFPSVKLYPRQSILQVCLRQGIVEQYFPPHEENQLSFLKKNWCFSTKRQPIDEIRNYFGDSIAFYFAFLGFYTKSLIVPSLVSLLQLVFGSWMNPFCALFNIIWSVIFLKRWKRKSNHLAYRWKTLGVLKYEEPRPGFKSKRIESDPITGKPVPVYPVYKTWWKEYLVSVPVMIICLYLAFVVMLIYFKVDATLLNSYNQDQSHFNLIMSYVPSVVYAILVSLMNKAYEGLATWLNNWENHRTQSSHEAHWIVKLITFEFANNFMSIFYVGFHLRDTKMLQWQIGTLLVVNQVFDNIVEVCLPLWWTFKSNRQIRLREKKVDTDSRIIKILSESKMPIYAGTYYDYLELYVQFGYVFLFASIFPFAPILALFNNLVEVRSDAIKLCYAYQRPHQRFASGINGAWMKAFEVLVYVSVITNSALLAMSPLMATISEVYQLSPTESLLFVVIIEHMIFGIIMVVNYLIPDISKSVRVAIAKDNYFRVSQVP